MFSIFLFYGILLYIITIFSVFKVMQNIDYAIHWTNLWYNICLCRCKILRFLAILSVKKCIYYCMTECLVKGFIKSHKNDQVSVTIQKMHPTYFGFITVSAVEWSIYKSNNVKSSVYFSKINITNSIFYVQYINWINIICKWHNIKIFFLVLN